LFLTVPGKSDVPDRLKRPVIALTMGDPAGVGPEIVLAATADRTVQSACIPIVFGDLTWLQLTQKRSRLPRLRLVPLDRSIDRHSIARLRRGDVGVVSLGSLPARLPLGRPTAAAGKASGDYIAAAVQAALDREVSAVVTAPINKISFRMGGWGRRYIGHTEMIAGLTKTKVARLMLVHGALRAIHVTSHVPLSQVARRIGAGIILETIRVAHHGLRQMGILRPRIAVCGLNPHAGDGGLLGSEDRAIIAPAVATAVRGGIRAVGPLSADAVWPRVATGEFDAGVAMYHDQGQIAVKMSAFQASRRGRAAVVGGVNVTLGLPIIRTSVAHGTAYDIAGKGTASAKSLVEAILMAVQMRGRERR